MGIAPYSVAELIIMVALSCQSLSFSFSEQALFEDLSFTLDGSQRVGLIGRNGCGKSTLLKLLMRQLEPESGCVSWSKDLRPALVEQQLPQELHSKAVFEAVLDAAAGNQLLDYTLEALLSKLGLEGEVLYQACSTLSGGELIRLFLARALIREPNLLLLDEPSNHLDLPGRIELLRVLTKSVEQPLIIASHDRLLLDAVTSSSLILRDRKIYYFASCCSSAREALLLADQAALLRRARQEREVLRIERSAKRLAEWGRTFDNEKLSARAKSMQKRAVRARGELSFVTQAKQAQLALSSVELRCEYLLEWEAAQLHTPTGKSLFAFQRILLRPGERVGLVAANGKGKSTFLKTLVQARKGNLQVKGRLRWRADLRLGYYDQHLHDLPLELTVLEFARRGLGDYSESRLHAVLHRAGFPFPMLAQRVASLSGGEQARLMLLSLQHSNPDLLLLDEPTNHLDLEGIEELQESLCQASTSCLFVSHDQAFLRAVAQRYLLIHEQRLYALEDWSQVERMLGEEPRLDACER